MPMICDLARNMGLLATSKKWQVLKLKTRNPNLRAISFYCGMLAVSFHFGLLSVSFYFADETTVLKTAASSYGQCTGRPKYLRK